MPITVPGLASNLHTDEMIKKLVEVEKRPIERIKQEEKILKIQGETWKAFKDELKKFDSILHRLYSYNRVFKDKSIIGEDDIEQYFSASILPSAVDSEHTINIKQLAQAHKISTDNISSDMTIPASKFTIKIGKHSEKFNFKGGSLKKFASFLRKNGKDLITVGTIKINDNEYRMTITSKFPGKNNFIEFIPDSNQDNKLFEKLGLIKINKSETDFSENFNSKTNPNASYNDNGYNNTPSLQIEKNKSFTYNFPNITIKDGELSFLYKTYKKKEKTLFAPQNNNINPIIADIGSVKIKDIIINSAKIILNSPENKNKKEKSKNNNMGSIKTILSFNDNSKKIINISFTSNWSKAKIDINKKIKSIIFKNNSLYNLEVDNIKIINKEKKLVYKNEIKAPADAKLVLDDIEIERDKNKDLNDIIDRVTLNLKNKTPHPITFRIGPDKKKIDNTIKDFIDQYNNIINFITIVGKNQKTTKPGEKNKKKKEQGILSNDIALMNIKSKLRSIVMDRYQTSLGDELAILPQIGISTGAWGSSWANINKGYLQLDEEKLNLAIDKFGDKIGEVFGYDSNDDKIIDTGVAYRLSMAIKPYIQLRGIIDNKIELTKTLIKSKDKLIADKEDRLKTYENNLREKFTRMEESLSKLKGEQQSLDNQLRNLNSQNKKSE